MITALDQNTALVLIDLQKGIAKMGTAHPFDKVVANAALLVDAFRKAGLPVVVVNVNPVGGPLGKARVQNQTVPQNAAMFAAGFTDIIDEIITKTDDIFITKKTWNAFYNTALHEELQKRNITGIVLAGVATSIGVEGTARAASELGYNISFATDAMTDRVASAHEHSIQIIFPRIGELGNTEEVIDKLNDR